MKFGMIKAVAATPSLLVGDCEHNAAQAIQMIAKAKAAGAAVLVLPELCLTGYTCGDLFFQRTLIDSAQRALKAVITASRGGELITVIGLPAAHDNKLYNCAAVIQNGRLLGIVPKTNLPTYGEFYELRNFAPAPGHNGEIELAGQRVPFGTKLLFRCAQQPDFCLGVEICEDLWVPVPPSTGLCCAGATIIANLSASNEVIGKAPYRRTLLTSQSARLLCGYVYADAGEGESTTDMVFSGHNLIAENGTILAESLPFDDGFAVTEIDVSRMISERRRQTTYPSAPEGYAEIPFDVTLHDTELTRPVEQHPFVPDNIAERTERCRLILDIQAHGLARRLTHTHAKTAIIGISGGLDSCVALLVCVRAMDILKRPRTDVVAVTMPCFGTTEHTKNNAVELCSLLGVTLKCINIAPAVTAHFADIGHDPAVADVTFENSQARERTQVLMDLSNEYGGFVVGTGDLSELALGWATYNGDHMSMYGVNASIPKTLMQHLVRNYSENCADRRLAEVLLDILGTPISPELLPAKEGEIDQKTEDIVGPYELHDFFLYYLLRFGYSPAKIFAFAKYAYKGCYDDATILFWLRTFCKRFFSQQFKRSCLPDGPKVGSITLSPRGDWRMPSDASSALWLSELDALK